MTLQELIDRAVIEATQGLTPDAASLITSDTAAEVSLNEVFQAVGAEMAKSESLRHILRETVSITLSSGVGTVPSQVLTEFMNESSVFVSGEPTVGRKMSFIAEYIDFTRPQDTRLGYYAMKGQQTLQWRNPGEAFSATLARSGAISLNVPCAPSVPAAASDTLNVAPEVLDNLQHALAIKMRGLASA